MLKRIAFRFRSRSKEKAVNNQCPYKLEPSNEVAATRLRKIEDVEREVEAEGYKIIRMTGMLN